MRECDYLGFRNNLQVKSFHSTLQVRFRLIRDELSGFLLPINVGLLLTEPV